MDGRWQRDGWGQKKLWQVLCDDFLPLAKFKRVCPRGLTRRKGISYLSNNCLMLLLNASVANGSRNEKKVSRGSLFLWGSLLQSTALHKQEDEFPLSSTFAKVELMASSRCSGVVHFSALANSFRTFVVWTELLTHTLQTCSVVALLTYRLYPIHSPSPLFVNTYLTCFHRPTDDDVDRRNVLP